MTPLAQCLDVLTRMCPDTCAAYGLAQTSDAELDTAIKAAATELHGADATKWPQPVLMACSVRALEKV